MTETRDFTTTDIPLHLTVDPWWELIEVLAFGTVCDLIDEERYASLVAGHVALVLDEDLEVAIGFVVQDPAAFDPLEHPDVEALWDDELRFHVPVLGLPNATVGEVLVAVRGRFAEDEPTADALHFHAALGAEDAAAALPEFLLALEAGDMKAHYALGYTLYDLGEHHRAYGHLRRYTELAPRNPWAWCWLGRAAAEIELLEEAREAYERALELDAELTAAAEFLAALPGPR